MAQTIALAVAITYISVACISVLVITTAATAKARSLRAMAVFISQLPPALPP